MVETQRGFSRRSFLKSTGLALAGGAALAGGTVTFGALAQADGADIQEEQVFVCNCTGNCGGNCSVQVHTRNGYAVDISRQALPEEIHEQSCQRGMSHLQRIYDPLRIKYPMRRVEGSERGAGEWERLSWDDAIAYICDKWKGYQQEFGPASIAFHNASGNFRPDTYQYVNRLIAYMGATNLANDYDQNGLMGLGTAIGFGLSQVGNDWRDVPNARTIFIWGTNVSEAQGVRFRYISDAQEGGSKVVCIDPVYTVSASKADKWVPIRPGTDGLLAIGLMKIALEREATDEEFLKTRTVGPFLVKKSDGLFVRLSDLGRAEAATPEDLPVMTDGQGNFACEAEGIDPVLEGTFEVAGEQVTTAYSLLLDRLGEYDLDMIAETCDIDPDTIQSLADDFFNGPTTVLTGFGPDHYANGHTFYTSVAALLALTGNFAKPGAGIGGSNVSTLSALGPDLTAIVAPADAPGGPTVHCVYLLDLIETGKYGGEDMTIKSIYAMNSNFLGNQAQRNDWLKVIDNIDLLVVADVYMTETAQHADVVLPVPHYFELESYWPTGTDYVRINEAAIDPQFESMGDFEIINLLGCGLGMEDKFSMTREEFMTQAFENETAQTYGMSWEKLKEEKFLYGGTGGPYIHGLTVPFTTPTARVQFYVEGCRPSPDLGQTDWDAELEALPYWEPPHEAWSENELASTYPLIFTSERAKFKVHTQFTYLPVFAEIDPEPTVKVSPVDAEARGIENGDMVRVFNDRGFMVCKAVLNPGNRPGMMVVDHGWQESQFVDGHYQALSSRWAHPHFANNNAFDCLVEVEKYEEA